MTWGFVFALLISSTLVKAETPAPTAVEVKMAYDAVAEEAKKVIDDVGKNAQAWRDANVPTIKRVKKNLETIEKMLPILKKNTDQFAEAFRIGKDTSASAEAKATARQVRADPRRVRQKQMYIILDAVKDIALLDGIEVQKSDGKTYKEPKPKIKSFAEFIPLLEKLLAVAMGPDPKTHPELGWNRQDMVQEIEMLLKAAKSRADKPNANLPMLADVSVDPNKGSFYCEPKPTDAQRSFFDMSHQGLKLLESIPSCDELKEQLATRRRDEEKAKMAWEKARDALDEANGNSELLDKRRKELADVKAAYARARGETAKFRALADARETHDRRAVAPKFLSAHTGQMVKALAEIRSNQRTPAKPVE